MLLKAEAKLGKAEDESREREIRTVDFILCKQHRGAGEEFKWRSE